MARCSFFYPLQPQKFSSLDPKMAEKQLIVAVEGTAAMGPYWQIIVSDYLEKIIRWLSA